VDVAELYQTERVVPVVIFPHPGRFSDSLGLGSDTRAYPRFRYLSWPLFRLRARAYLDSPNL
jgi:hypothetical protein